MIGHFPNERRIVLIVEHGAAVYSSSMAHGVAQRDPILRQFVAALAPIRESIEEMRLFGSRARGEARPDSDYDVLIVLARRTPEAVSACYDAVMAVLLATGRLVSLKIFPRDEFDRLRAIPTPFMRAIQQEGIPLGFDDQSSD